MALVAGPMLMQAATITVTGTGDTPAVDGLVTLREAIISANSNASINSDVSAQSPGAYGTDTINFNIAGAGVKTINVTTALPVITGVLTINGYTQGVASANTLANGDNAVLLVELNGAGAGAGVAKVGVAGLTLGTGSGGSIIRGLIINRFSGDGILIRSNTNSITGNFIGTNPAGTAPGPGNANTTFDLVTPMRAGIYLDNASNNTIGGTTPAVRNVVSGNLLDNIHIVGDAGGAMNNVIQGNFVGINAAGTGIIFASGFWGVEIGGVNAASNSIGGTGAGSRNVIGGNGDGIDLDNATHDNAVQGNFLGTGADGVTATGNRLHGIAIRDLGGNSGISGNQIGGTVAGAGNLVANNGGSGVAVFGDPNTSLAQNVDNAILGNSIFNNGQSSPGAFLGIDLVTGTQFPTDDGNTANDFGDGDSGPNKLQNYPILSSFTTGGSTTITGALNSRNNNGAGRTYRIEFFNNQAGSGEGQTFLGFKEVTIGANPGPFVDKGENTVAINVTGLPPVPSNASITATATELNGGPGTTPLSTSEFSPAIAAPTPAPTPPPDQLLNIATRARVETGDNVLIGGFITGGGNGTTRVIVRALGPSLAGFGIPGVLADPILELHDVSGNVIASNNNWKFRDADDSSQQAEIEATTIPPTNDLESALIATLTSGNYTIVVRGVAGATGVATVEVYNLH